MFNHLSRINLNWKLFARMAHGEASRDNYPFRLSVAEWKEKLTAHEYHVLRLGGTESYGKGEFCSYFPKRGYFACRGCRFPLYSATSKFKDCGWDAYETTLLNKSTGLVHVELARGNETRCANCGSHLGHVFFGEGHTKTNERH